MGGRSDYGLPQFGPALTRALTALPSGGQPWRPACPPRFHRVHYKGMLTDQVTFTEAELLLDHPIAEPLIEGGVRCHGGFDTEGTYLSPRTRFRIPAITAWQAQNAQTFGTEPLHVPLDTWPAHFPNVAQARHLITAGVPEPLIATLTRIGTVEGFGANIRFLQPGDLQPHFEQDVRGTALDHLGRGLFEAHGRDEAGWEEEAGHRDMWFAARDIAFQSPTTEIDADAMLARMGFGPAASGSSPEPTRALPTDIDPNLEMIARLMIRVLLIEVQAFHTFAWAEEWLSDPNLVAGEGRAADLVSYIRADETPHVDYLRTALSEMRDRTWIGSGGSKHPGTEMIGTLWQLGLEQSLGAGREQTRASVLAEVEHWCGKHPHGTATLEAFHALAGPA